MKILSTLLGIVAAASALAAIFIYSGVFNVAADEPHSTFVYRVMETVRDRSIAVRIKNIEVPPLDAPQLIAEGARDYHDMCSGCHLAPGLKESELRHGLYPKPPDLTEHLDASAAEMFWVIKHGIKLSAMPAWGLTHEDARIWSIVAFLQRLPDLSLDQYQILVNTKGRSGPHQHRHNDNHGKPSVDDEHHSHQS